MIIEFSVGNFRSFKDVQTLSMVAANITSKYKGIDKQNAINVNDKWTLLKSKAIYGANASGKSNLIRALVTFISLVNNSVKDDGLLKSLIDRFLLSSDNDEKPAFFQLIFLVDGVYYRYGFEATDNKIVSEWLFGTPGKREVQFFIRQGKQIEINENQFEEGAKIINLVRDNSLFLTVVKFLNGKIAGKLVDFISDIIVISGLSDKRLYSIASASLDNKEIRNQIVRMLKIADVGIEDIRKFDVPDNKTTPPHALDEGESLTKRSLIVTSHQKTNQASNTKELVPFIFDFHESEGSKKIFEISPVILQALEEGRPLVMDEFDARFHPLLTKKLVELFNSTANNNQTQFLFVTHDTNLLQALLLRRDQICFVEKDKLGASHVYSLAEFKGVRNDASFEKDYIQGKYGAIPFLGNFETIFEKHAKKDKGH